jgi:hypothetical protein
LYSRRRCEKPLETGSLKVEKSHLNVKSIHVIPAPYLVRDKLQWEIKSISGWTSAWAGVM